MADVELLNVMTFDTIKGVSILDIGSAYQAILTLTTPSREAGKYLLGYTLTYTFDSITTSVYIRWRVDGGTWNEFIKEPKDTTDSEPFMYFYPFDFADGIHTIDVEMRKETVAGTLNVDFIDIIFQRVA